MSAISLDHPVALPANAGSRPYLVGAGIGVLSIAVFVLVNKPIGITTSLSQVSGGAIGAGSLHALVGAVGMLVGGVLYGLSFGWVQANVLSVWTLGKARLPWACRTMSGSWAWRRC
jgi:hypothetical protein